MKTLLAKDSENLIVFDDKMKKGIPSAILWIITACFFLAFTLICFMAPVLDEFFQWIDSKGPIIGACIILVCSLVFSFKWAYKKVKG